MPNSNKLTQRMFTMFISSGLLAYAHRIAWAVASEHDLEYWAEVAESAAIACLITSCVFMVIFVIRYLSMPNAE